ncbi:MAG: AmmeMemoRadiSam system protein A [Thermodesulfovibrionia bacterium]|nr:AmmeMemoRadiSam system protein A [Thermodesulfovibrionia bacterium]
MHPLVKLAKETIRQYVTGREIIAPPAEPSPEMKDKAGVFVSLKMHGELRGCIGTFSPTTENVAKEIIQNAISAATQDPRFPPVTSSELDKIVYSVDVLSAPEKVKGKDELDVEKYGVIVKRGNRRGLLLPDLEGVDTVEEQLDIACMKAGIAKGEEIEIYRFEVKRYK